ncbi:hypothetical protein [Haliovirga abyssi]|uniref:Double-GTPase 1 domain-containing protein n=1 Tax=Haliovirga abyssi TaxID=2996794 RepID=A0AAU9DSC2_9FUSO|nr:hypothetical protein [Haliovirga abyssi]BDU51523.1 hypothetical protein HLVA_20920 [Haliovirga abyssi]
MGKNIEVMVDELKKYSKKPIGIFGARASGKTMFLTVLYGLTGFANENDKLSIICNTAESRNYLKKNYMNLLEGKLPSRTEVNEFTKINMNLFHNGNSYNVKTFDFAGELLKDVDEKEVDPSFLELQNKMYDFFKMCSGLLIFLEPSTDKKVGFERQIEVDKLFSFLKNENIDLNIPMGIAITKWDKISTELEKRNYEEEEEKVKKYISDNKIYHNIYHLISGISDYTKMFPISAFGEARENDLPPEELKPFNVFSPLIWASNKRDQEWVKKIKFILNKNINPKDAKEVVNEFVLNIENKELKVEVEKAYTKYLNKRRNKKIVAGLLIIGTIGGASGYFLKNNYDKQSSYNKIMNETNRKLQKNMINEFITKYGSNNKYSGDLLKLKKDIYIRIIKIESDLNTKLNLINNYIVEYKDDSNIEELKKLKRKTEKDISSEKNYKNLENSLSKEKDNYKKYLLSKDYSEKYPEYKKDVIQNKIKIFLKLADKEKYDEIEKLYENKKFNQLYNEIETYLNTKEYQDYKKEVLELKSSLRDNELFIKLKNSIKAYNSNKNEKNLNGILRNSESYLSNSNLLLHEKEAKNIISQINKIKKGINSEFEIDLTLKKVKHKYIKTYVIINIDGKKYEKSAKLNKKNVYVGSFINKFRIGKKIDIDIYLDDKKGVEIQTKHLKLSFGDINKNILVKTEKGDELILRLQTNQIKYEIGG